MVGTAGGAGMNTVMAVRRRKAGGARQRVPRADDGQRIYGAAASGNGDDEVDRPGLFGTERSLGGPVHSERYRAASAVIRLAAGG